MANQPDYVNSGALGTMLAICAIAMVGAVLGVTALVRTEHRQLVSERSEPITRQFRSLKAEQEQQLNAPPAWVDKEKGLVSVPISKAMELTLVDVRRGKTIVGQLPKDESEESEEATEPAEGETEESDTEGPEGRQGDEPAEGDAPQQTVPAETPVKAPAPTGKSQEAGKSKENGGQSASPAAPQAAPVPGAPRQQDAPAQQGSPQGASAPQEGSGL